MQIVFSGQIPKDTYFPDAIEDAYCIDQSTGRMALSDGASESFDSKTWAQLLVKLFILNPHIDADWLSLAVSSYHAEQDFASLSWSKQAAFERGSYATLVGVQCCEDDKSIQVISVGDSVVVLLAGSEFLDSFPYKSAEEFRQRPTLFSTSSERNDFVGEGDFHFKHSMKWGVDSTRSTSLLCMTDALAEWALSMAEVGVPQWEILLNIRDISQLGQLVESERGKKLLRLDDVTLINVTLDGAVKRELSHPREI